MINGLISVAVIFLIFAVGFFFTIRQYWPQNASAVLSVIVVKVAAPSLALISVVDRFTPELIRRSVLNLMIIVLYMAILFLIGKLFARIFRLPDGKRHIFEVNFIFNNAIFIGLPVSEIVFGSEGLPYLFTFYLVSLTVFWSVGAYKLSKSSAHAEKGFSPKKIINPGFVAVLLACLLVEMNLSIPLVLDSVLRYLGALCVPLSLLVIGSNLVVFSKGIPKIYKDEWMIVAAKFIVCPLLMFGLLTLFHVDGLAFKVLMLSSSMPCHMQTSILAEYYGAESAYASKLISITTLASLITIPAYAAILSHI